MQDGDSRSHPEVAVFALVEQGLASLGIQTSLFQMQQLSDLVGHLSYWAQRINLTGHRDPLEITSRLILDAAALSHAVPELASAESLADLGSGAGFPGLPLAILHPHLDVYLVDSRLKRNHFQREVKRKLGLARVHPLLGRSDELEPVACGVVIAQAMTRPEEALELMLPWARQSGMILLPASESATAPTAPSEVEPLELRRYEVPGTTIRRKLWLTHRRG